MKTLKRVLVLPVAIFAAMLPVRAIAQSDRAPPYATGMSWRYDRPPVPPADIPNVAPIKNNMGPARHHASARRSTPLPRTRPPDVTAGIAKETTPQVQSERRVTPAEPRTAEPRTVPARSDVAPGVVSAPTSPAMVPIAPLE